MLAGAATSAGAASAGLVGKVAGVGDAGGGAGAGSCAKIGSAKDKLANMARAIMEARVEELLFGPGINWYLPFRKRGVRVNQQ